MRRKRETEALAELQANMCASLRNIRVLLEQVLVVFSAKCFQRDLLGDLNVSIPA